MKVFVEWGYPDFTGTFYGGRYTWFNTRAEAEAWIESQSREKNGDYFRVVRIGEANYDLYLQMRTLEEQWVTLKRYMEQAQKEFEKSIY